MVLACCSPSLSAEVLVQVVKHRKQLTQPLVTTSQEELLHYLASCLVMAGVDIRTVQELMGHETLAMTVRYAHLSAGPPGSTPCSGSCGPLPRKRPAPTRATRRSLPWRPAKWSSYQPNRIA